MQMVNQINLKDLKKRLVKCNDCGKEVKIEELKEDGYAWVCPACKTKRDNIRVQEQIKRCIPLKYQNIETDNKKDMKNNLNRNLFLYGDVGTGKTVFACSLLKRYITEGKQVKFISYPAWIMELQNAWRNEIENPFDMAKKIARFSGWLCLDDIGAEKLTDYVKQITYYIINEREQWNLPIIITSNYTLDEINDIIDRRIASRIAGMCKILHFGRKDRRINRKITGVYKE